MATKITDFLKELTTKTGLYGEDLYDLIREKVLSTSSTTSPTTERDDWRPHKEESRFIGNRTEIIDYYLSAGGDSKIARYMGGMCPELVCVHCAKILGAKKFIWVAPIKIRRADGNIYDSTREFVVVWDSMTAKYIDV